MKKLLLPLCLSIAGCFDSNTSTTILNHSPSIETLPTIQAIVGNTTRVNIIASDVDGDMLTYSLLDNPSWVSLNGSTISITPSSENEGQHSFKVMVSDGTLSSVVEAMLVVRIPMTPIDPDLINHAPSVDALPTIQAIAGDINQVTVTATDKDDDTLTYTLVDNPEWVMIEGNIILVASEHEHIGQHRFKVRVSDGSLSTEIDAMLVVSEPQAVNRAPKITALPAIEMTAGESRQISVAASDEDGDDLTYTLIDEPTWVAIEGNVISIDPSATNVGSYDFKVQVSDGELIAVENVTLVVNPAVPVNRIPMVEALPMIQATAGQTHHINVIATDEDGDELHYELVDSPDWVTIQGDVITVESSSAHIGQPHTFKVKVSDGEATVEIDATVVVVPPIPPVIETLPIIQAIGGETQQIRINASGQNSDNLDYELVGNNPSWVRLVGNTLLVSPPADNAGSYTVKVRVSDGVLSTETTATIVVKKPEPVNQAPTIRPLTTIQALVGEPHQVNIIASDADGDPLRYTLDSEPSWVTIQGNVISVIATSAHVGEHRFKVRVSDGELSSEIEATVVVSEPNRAPSVQPLATIQALAGETKTINIGASDLDGDALTYTLVGNPSWITIQGNAISVSAVSANIGQHSFKVSVSDGELSTVIDATVVVSEPNRAPNVQPLATIQALAGETHVVNIVASDLDGDVLSYTLVGNPSWVTIQGNTISVSAVSENVGQHSFKVTVSDGELSTEIDAMVVVSEPNRAPNVEPLATIQAIVGEPQTVSIMASDLDGDVLSYTLVGNPSWVTIQGNTISVVADSASVGQHRFKVTVSDGELSTEIEASVVVSEPNRAPTVQPLATIQALVGEAKTVNIAASDLDGDALTYTLVGNPSWVTIQGNAISVVAAPENVGQHSFKVTVSDGELSTEIDAILVVSEPNRAPSVQPLSTIQALVGETHTVNITASDLDGDALSYTLVGNPNWVTIQGNTISVAAASENVGQHSFKVTVSDGELSTEVDATLVVSEPNRAPSVQPLATIQALAGDTQTVNITASDLDGDALTYTLVGNPSWVTIQGNTISVAAASENVGQHRFKVTVSDGELSTEVDAMVVVSEPNRAPTVLPIAPIQAIAGETHSINISASDLDGDALTYTLVGNPSWVTIQGNTISVAAASANVGQHSFKVTVSDGELSTDVDATVVVSEPNRAPIVQPIATIQATAGESHSISVAASDPDGDAMTYTLIGNPSWITIQGNTISVAATSANLGQYSFKVRVTGGELSTEVDAIIVVSEPNRAPTVQPLATIQALAGETQTVNIAASDLDGDALTYTLVGNPSWITIQGNTISVAAVSANVGQHSFKVTVSDGELSTVIDATVVVSEPNRAPNVQPLATIQALAGETQTVNIAASDLDGDTLTYTLTGNPSWITIQGNTISVAAVSAHVGQHSFKVTVSDGELSTVIDATVVVSEPNRAPNVQPLATIQALVGETKTVNIAASDLDGDALSYTLVGSPSWVTIQGNAISVTAASANVGQHSFKVRVSDGELSTEIDAVLVVSEPNRAPNVQPLATIQALAGQTHTVSIAASDLDGDALSYTLAGNPSWITIQGNVISVAAVSANVGQHSFKVTVSDGELSTEINATVVVSEPNRAPSVQPLATIQALAGETQTANITASDLDGDTLAYTLTGNPSWITIQGNTISVVAVSANVGQHSFKVTVSDGELSTVIDATVVVSEPNRAPTVQPLATIQALAGETKTVNIGASDLDGDALTYTLVGNPSWVTIQGNAISVAAVSANVGQHSFKVRVSDGELSTEIDATVVVSEPNRAPTVQPLATIQALAGQTHTVTVAASDLDGDALNYTLVGSPSWVTIQGNVISVAAASANVGQHSFKVRVSDGELSTEVDATIVVTEPNRAPSVQPLATIQAIVGETQTVNITASDLDGDTLTYTLVGSPSWVRLQGNVISVTAASANVGQHSFKVSVSDGELTTEIDVTVEVNEPNRAPTITAIPSIEVKAGIAQQIKVTATDLDNDTLTYSLIGSPNWATIQGDTIWFVPLEAHVGTHSFKVQVSDGELQTEADVNVTVSLVNYEPQVADIDPIALDALTSTQVQVVASDRYNDPLTYRLENAPDFVSIDQQGLMAITSPSTAGNFTFQVTVSDGTFNITKPVKITVNNPYYGSDNDEDGIDDGVEVEYGLNPTNQADAFLDSDGDGLSNLEELFGQRLLMHYNAQYNGPILDNPQWKLETIGNRGHLHNHDYVQKNGQFVQQLHDDDGTRTSQVELSHNLQFDKFSDELYQHGGLLSLSVALHREGGAINIFIDPSHSMDFMRKALMLELDKLGTDGVRTRVVHGPTVDFSSGHPAGKVHKLEIQFYGNGTYGGEVRLDGNVVHSDIANLFVTRATLKEGLTLLTSRANYRGFDIYDMQVRVNNPYPVTNPNSKDSDGDGIDDRTELEIGLNALDPVDGYNADSDGDGVSNGLEIAHGFNPLDARDQINIDSDGDGVNNDIEIENGMDPFVVDDLTLDDDNDGLSTQVELEYALNPSDPSDGFNADNDGDGVSNGVEINNNTNPNDHKLQLKDHFTIKLIVDDSNNDGRINVNDTAREVTLDRYSLRKNNAELIFFQDQQENRYTETSLLPEVRTFRGRVSDQPDSAVFATIWDDCTISYSVFFGANAKPDFRLGSDAAHVSFANTAFDHVNVCNTSNVSEAKYQRGLQANFESIPYRADTEPAENQNYFPKGEDFHLFERSQSFQASYRIWSAFGQKNLMRTFALMEHNANMGDHIMTRSYYERVSITDFLIELTGKGDPGDGTGRPDWDDNWDAVRNEFWSPRRTELDKYWLEHVYWNQPDGAEGYAYGQRLQSSLNPGFYIHEMGHNLGSRHEGFPERFQGTNAMGQATLPAATSIVHQNIASPRRLVSKSGLTQHHDLRIGVPHWNFHPLAQPDHISLYRDETAQIAVLDNDSDANNHKLTITSVVIVDNASDEGAIDSQITITPDQKIEITPPKGFIGMIDAYYIIEDETGLSSRGILHINVEHKGISDIMTYDHACIDDANAVATYDGLTGFSTLFNTNPRDTKVSVASWGYNRRTLDSSGQQSKVSCASHVSESGNSLELDDKAATWASVQYPMTNNQLKSDERSHNHEYHPHLYEINNKDFSIMFWYRPSAEYTGSTVLARRGRNQGYGFDGDGWVIGANGTTLTMTIHDKTQTTTNRVLTLEVENLAELVDTGSWAHIAMTVDWTTKELIAFVNGQEVGKVAIPPHFSLVSSSGTMQAYSWGSYAVFGQQSAVTGSEPGHYATGGNNGFDDLVIAHTALTASRIQSIYQGNLPAHAPTPANGRTIDMTNISSLQWRPHTDIQGDVREYNVYLAEDELSVSTHLPSALLGSTAATSFDVSGQTFDRNKAYYWRVDTVLNDGTVIPGEVWSFWQQQIRFQAQSFWQGTRYQFAPVDESAQHVCRGVHIDHWLSENTNQW